MSTDTPATTLAPDQEQVKGSLEAYLEWIDVIAAERVKRIDEALAQAEFDLGLLSKEAEAAQKNLVASQVNALNALKG